MSLNLWFLTDAKRKQIQSGSSSQSRCSKHRTSRAGMVCYNEAVYQRHGVRSPRVTQRYFTDMRIERTWNQRETGGKPTKRKHNPKRSQKHINLARTTPRMTRASERTTCHNCFIKSCVPSMKPTERKAKPRNVFAVTLLPPSVDELAINCRISLQFGIHR